MSIIPLRDRSRESIRCNPVIDDVSLRSGTSRGVLQPPSGGLQEYRYWGRDRARCERGSEEVIDPMAYRAAYHERASWNARSQMDRGVASTVGYDATADRLYTEAPMLERNIGSLPRANRLANGPAGHRDAWGGRIEDQWYTGLICDREAPRDSHNRGDRGYTGTRTFSHRDDWGANRERTSHVAVETGEGWRRDPTNTTRDRYLNQARALSAGAVLSDYGVTRVGAVSGREGERGNCGVPTYVQSVRHQ